MRITQQNKTWLQRAGYPDAVRKTIENLNGLLVQKKTNLEKAKNADPEFYGVATGREFVEGRPKISPAEIKKAVADLSKHVAGMEATLVALESDLAEFEE